MMILQWIFFITFGFGFGGILFSYHLPLILKKTDVTECNDDHNPGAANAVKSAGWGVGLLCLFCDLAKGFLPVFLSFRYLDPENLLFSLVMFAPVLGHAAAPFYKIGGGKAIATTFGVLCALIPHSYIVLILAFWYIFFSVVIKINPTTRRSILTFSFFSISVLVAVLLTGKLSFTLGCLLISATVIRKHVRMVRVKEAAAVRVK